MTKPELIRMLTGRFPVLVQRDTEQCVNLILGAIEGSLVRGERVEIRGFGSFTTSYRMPRIGRNPKTGERVSVPAKCFPSFKAGKELRHKVDQKA
jgi:integration host factor subunit beta